MILGSKSGLKTKAYIEDSQGEEIELDVTFSYEAPESDSADGPGSDAQFVDITAMHQGACHYKESTAYAIESACQEKIELLQSELDARYEDSGMSM